MKKNTTGQKIAVYAYNVLTQLPQTGDAANITGQISKDGGAIAATNDVNPTELSSANAKGIYIFDSTQAETNADLIVLDASSSTANVTIDPVMAFTTDVPSEVSSALDTAIPGSPTADSINERVQAIDDLTQAGGSGDLAALTTAMGAVQGTTFDPLTDSLENIRDRGDAAWKTGTSSSGSTVIMGPLVASKDPANRTASPITLEMFQLEAKTFPIAILDSDGVAVDLSAMVLRFIVENTASPPVSKFGVEAVGITVSGAGNNIANVTVSTTASATASSEWVWRLWNTTSDVMLAHGPFIIRQSTKNIV